MPACVTSHGNHGNIGRKSIHSSEPRLGVLKNTNFKRLVVENLKTASYSPKASLVLGFGGLIPFVAAPGYMITLGGFCPSIFSAQVAYGACILSFIGGVRWGLTLSSQSDQKPGFYNLGYSVLPPLVAWGSFLVSPLAGAAVVIAGLGATGYADRKMRGYPESFKAMRFCLSSVAILSILLSMILAEVHRLKQDYFPKSSQG